MTEKFATSIACHEFTSLLSEGEICCIAREDPDRSDIIVITVASYESCKPIV